MKTRSNMPLFVLECSDVKALSNSQIDLLRCGDYLVKKDASGEHAYKVTFKSATGMCLTYHDASVIETQSYDKVGGNWVYNSEDKTELPINGTYPSDLTIDEDLLVNGDLGVVGDLSVNGDAKLFENIVDQDGHKRFIEGDILVATIQGVTLNYGKWSLSGTHLMIVFAPAIANETVIEQGYLTNFSLPKWIYDKIATWFGNQINAGQFSARASNGTSQTVYASLRKSNASNFELGIYLDTNFTANADRVARIQFDLLIDNE